MTYPYEIHITVQDADREQFTAACRELNIKPVLLDLQSRAHGVLKDAMTSSRIVGTNEDAMVEAARIGFILRVQYGMAVCRYKIETVPWHPAASAVPRKPEQYLESHLQLQISDMTPGLWYVLTLFCQQHKLHLSSNVFKKTEAGIAIHMATIRDYKASVVEFTDRVNTIAREIGATFPQITVGDVEIEFALMDTLSKHDAKWMAGPSLCPEVPAL